MFAGALGVWSSVGTSVWLGHQYHHYILLNKAKNNNPNMIQLYCEEEEDLLRLTIQQAL